MSDHTICPNCADSFARETGVQEQTDIIRKRRPSGVKEVPVIKTFCSPECAQDFISDRILGAFGQAERKAAHLQALIAGQVECPTAVSLEDWDQLIKLMTKATRILEDTPYEPGC